MSLRKSSLAATGIGLAAAIVVSSALAQGMGGGAAQRFDDMDKDGNNQVSREEHTSWQESVFAAMDADESGDLTETEYMAVRMGPGPRADTPGPRHAERQEQKRKRFGKMDTDDNGRVSKQGFLDDGARRFEEADADDSGALTFEEFRELHRKR